MPEILFIDLLKLLKEGVRTDRVRLSVGVSSTNRKPLKRQSIMKTYCKTVDITDRKLIQKAVYKCLKKKYKRKDSLKMFSEYTGLPTDTIKGMFNEFGLNGMQPMVETVVDGVREEIIQGNIHFQPIWYKEKIDASSQKVRRIGIQNIKQQIYDYIAVEAMKDFLRRIGEYQCAALKGRGQSYGIKAIKRWMRNKDIRYAGQCDISKCYPSIDRNKLMEFLRKYIKNEPLLELIEMLIMTFDTGLSIGSYLSQYLCNLFLSQIYHEIAENMYRIRKKRNGTIERVNLVKHQLFFMDDILILGTNAKDIHKAMKLIIQKADEMKARFDTTQESVTVRQIDGMDYVYICLNENIVKEIPDGQEEEQTYHEYDYKEISEPTGTLDLADVKANPEKYLNYGNEPKRTDTERIDVLEATTDDIILMMADLIGGEA